MAEGLQSVQRGVRRFAQTLCEILNPQNAFIVLHNMHLADTSIQNPKVGKSIHPLQV